MASTDTQIAASLRRIEAIAQSAAGARELKPLAERVTGDLDKSIKTIAPYKRLIVNVHRLEKAAEETPPQGDKPAPLPKAAKATIALSLKIPLPGGKDVYPIASINISKSGVTDLDLDFCPSEFSLIAEVEGEAEYSIYGI
jgi:hypothetical protein